MAAGLGQAEVVLGTAWVLGGCGVRLKQGAPRGKVGWSLFSTCVPTSGLGDFFIRFLLVLFQGSIEPYWPCGGHVCELVAENAQLLQMLKK